MTSVREQFLRVMKEGDISEGFPVAEFAPFWHLTLQRWEDEGMPKGLSYEDWLDYFGLVFVYRFWAWKSPTTLEARGLANLPEDWRFEQPMIHSESDYNRIRPALFPPDLSPAEIEAMNIDGQRQERGDTWLTTVLEGPFWFPRMLLGVEAHLLAFFEQPEFMKRIIDDLTEFNLLMIDRICEVYTPDIVVLAEDLAYRNGSMISREIFDEFLAPHYRRVVPVLKARGILPMVDSDGFVEPLIPWFESVGIAGMSPMERQAGVDVNRIRGERPEHLMYGGFDKMVMHQGEGAIRAELDRLRQVIRSGYYIPLTDHQVPPSVSLADYRLYLRLLREFSDEVAREARAERR